MIGQTLKYNSNLYLLHDNTVSQGNDRLLVGKDL